MVEHEFQWTNRSVVEFAQGGDPVATIQSKARETVVMATQCGWDGPPFDPFQLAELLGHKVAPNPEIVDARTTLQSGAFLIEYNPLKSAARIRFSVAHEIAHTLFSDCADTVRNRSTGQRQANDEWQLEMLCNIAAAEFLMPSGYATLKTEDTSIDNLLELQRAYRVSTEALLIRVAKLTQRSCAMFVAVRQDDSIETRNFQIDYSVSSRYWDSNLRPGTHLNDCTVLPQCTAIGFTAKGHEQWNEDWPRFRVECVGIPPYPGRVFPRVAGVVELTQPGSVAKREIVNLVGDALSPRGEGTKILAHVVNDRTANWGGRGFARQVRIKWQHVQDEFREWAQLDRTHLTLGAIHIAAVDNEMDICHMVAQKGYGPSDSPRIRYRALDQALVQLADAAIAKSATVHMPLIGTGEAGGNWDFISELIDERLVRRGVSVSVYTLPGTELRPEQVSLPI